MENTKVLSLMWKYIEDNDINWAKVQKMTCNSWMDAHEWSDALEEKITSSRLVSMYNAGLVDRIKNKATLVMIDSTIFLLLSRTITGINL